MLTIQYPDFRERLAGREVVPGVWELTEFSLFLPLAPGDRVKVNDGQVIGYTNLSDLIVVEAFFRMDCTDEQVQEAARVWEMATSVRVSSPLTVLVAGGNARWLEHEVEQHPLVEWVDLLRVPMEQFKWDEEVRKHG